MKIYTVLASPQPHMEPGFIGNYASLAEAERVIDDLFEARYGTRPAMKSASGQYIHIDGNPGSNVFAVIETENREEESLYYFGLSRKVDLKRTP